MRKTASSKDPADTLIAALLLTGCGGLIIWANRRARALQHSGYRLYLGAPPLTGQFDPRLPLSAGAPTAIGGLGVWRAPSLARSFGWRTLLLVSIVGSALWASALAIVDGTLGFTLSTSRSIDYARAVPLVVSPGRFLSTFVQDLPLYTGHVQTHPPGMVLVLWLMNRVGLSGGGWEAALEFAGGAIAVPFVLIAIRDVAAERTARTAAPFLVLTSAAVFWSSGDAFYLGVGAVGCTLVVLAGSRTGIRAAILGASGGALLGFAAYLSYGLVLLWLIPGWVALRRRAWYGFSWALAGAAVVVAVFTLEGFSWWDGFSAARGAYSSSVTSSNRPYAYSLIGDPAALAIAIGPAAIVALIRARGAAWTLACGAVAAMVIALVTGLSKAEVERIWLPFMPWIVALTGAAFADIEIARRWLAAQVVWALGLQLLVRSPW